MNTAIVVGGGKFIFSTDSKQERDRFVSMVGSERVLSERRVYGADGIENHWTLTVGEDLFEREELRVRRVA